MNIGGVYADLQRSHEELNREGHLNLASGAANPHNLTGSQSVIRPPVQTSMMTGSTVRGIAASRKEAARHFDDARNKYVAGTINLDNRSGHVQYRPDMSVQLVGERPDDDRDPGAQRYAYNHDQISVTHVLFAFLLAGIVLATGLRIFNNYTKANDWVATMSDRGGIVDAMDNSTWRVFVKSLGA
eukprot:CAMPEP_0118958040 /NCGR_PEP_ID=MMETSP1169-20130426/62419_1 /TAXON_ID=36882 /ORGANISM="Pyramimonas obovata, Strain CCMP722" /LENGTH=184 /DNA_ID=CAMNT_0006906147 /DNA_START=135 /DNA_END=689 /DNA_ORIENTATION=+